MPSEDKKECIVMGGKGQVGSALVRILRKKYSVGVLEVDEGLTATRCDYLHVSIPWSDKFIESVKEAIAYYGPKHTIIHSTVPVGTTRAIGIDVSHSPVRGQHSDLYKSLLTFVKYVGCQNKEGKDIVISHMKKVGFHVEQMDGPDDTELAKLLCLSRYLNDIAFYQVADDLCNRYGLRNALVNEWTRTYNLGYKGTKWVRPVLDFPRHKVGGHCVMPVSKILAEQTNDPWLNKNIDLFKEQVK